MLLLSGARPTGASAATVTTNKSDYPWFSTVYISGSGFGFVVSVNVTVTDPNGLATSWYVTTDITGSFSTSYQLGNVAGNYTVVASDGSSLATTTFHDAAEAANLDQCTNGPFQKGTITPEPCLVGTVNGGVFSGTSFSNWVNGNANGAKSHWQEGDFIAYRVDVTGLTAGTHNIVFHYDTVHSGKHALDYIGSFDYTETTALASSPFHYNFNNPCVDLLGTTACPKSPSPSPASVLSILAPLLVNCGGSAGTPPTPIAGDIKAFAPAGSVTLTSMTYTAQNVLAGTGQCSTTAQLFFTTTSGTSEVVLTWGGHIAREAEWGAGNSASFISGSPYHMSLDFLDGASTGSQDRALATSAIFFAPTISTDVKNAADGTSITNSIINVGTSVYDTATLTGASSNAGGTVYYNFFNNGACTGTPATNQSVSVSSAIVPNSPTHGPLAAGYYAFNAFYSGDDLNLPAKSPCEPFQVGKVSSAVATHIYVAGTTSSDVQGTSQPLGTSVYDTAIVTATPFTPTGTVTYSFFTNGACTAPASTTQTVIMSSGLVPDSSVTGQLQAGSYSFQAAYSGDSNYDPSTSPCETLTIAKASSSVATHIYVVGTTSPDVQGTSQALGTSVYDTATVTATPFTPTGSVTYTFFSGGCTGTVLSTKTVTLSGGLAPNSDATGALATGSYAFQAHYGGDGNYDPSTSPCEPLTINKAPTTTSTAIYVAGTTSPDVQGTTVPLGTTVYDKATVTTQVNGFTIGGTVTYKFYATIGCTGSFSSETVAVGTVSSNHGPLTAGGYGFIAVYSGDPNYEGSTGTCEPVTVGMANSATATHLFVVGTTSPDIQGTTKPLGTNVYDTAIVTATPFTATGTVTYSFFTNINCAGTPSSTEVVTLDSGGLAPNAAATGPLAAGSYSFRASYSGDSNYNPSTSPCEPLTIAKASTSVATQIFVVGTTTGDVQGTSQPLGTNVYDTATVTATPFTPTGTVTYTFFKGDCISGTVVSTQTVDLNLDGSVPASDATGALMAGSYAFQASYSGDSNYKPSTGACEPLTISKATTSVSTEIFVVGTSSGDVQGTSQPLGTNVYDTATVTATPFTPTGTVTYTFFKGDCISGTVVSTQTVDLNLDGSVPASDATGALMAGSYAFQASYSGDSNYQGSTGPCETLTINQAGTSTATALFVEGTSSPDVQGTSQPLGTSVYDTATVTATPFIPTGDVVYSFFTNINCGGTATSTQTVTLDSNGLVPDATATGPLQAGSYSFQAEYSGDTNYIGSTSPCEILTIPKADTSTATHLFAVGTTSPDIQGTSQPLATNVYDTAVLTASPFTPTGSVTYTFFKGDCISGTVASTQTVGLNLDGTVPNSDPTGALAAGSYAFQAHYSGDGNYNPSTSPCEPLTINPASTTTVTDLFQSDGTPIPLSSSVPLGTSVYDLATVSPEVPPFAITGNVVYSFYSNDACSGAADQTFLVSVGSPSGTVGPLAAGKYSFQASYVGDSNYIGSTSACEPFYVNKADTSGSTAVVREDTDAIVPLSGTIPLGTTVHDTATVGTQVSTFVIGGTVTYHFFASIDCTGTPSDEVVTLSGGLVPNSSPHGPLAAGDYSFRADYSGDSNYNPSTSSCEPFHVAKAPTTTTTAIFVVGTTGPDIQNTEQPLGTLVYDLATVATQVDGFVIGGTVTYEFFATLDCTGTFSSETVAVGTASSSHGPLAAGSYGFIAIYSGDANYVGSTGACEPLTINKAPTTTSTAIYLAGTTGPDIQNTEQPLGSTVYDVATVATQVDGFVIGGTVTYEFFATIDCTGSFGTEVVAVGSASSNHGPLAAGSYGFIAIYSGDANYEGSTGACEPLTIAKGPTETTTAIYVAGTTGPDVQNTAVPLGTTVYDLATVGPKVDGFTIGGTVTYEFFTTLDCTGTFGTETVAVGTASSNHGPLAAGVYGFIAVYSGDANYEASVGECEPLTVAQFPPSALTTALFTSADVSIPLGGSVPLGTSVYDTATFGSQSTGFTRTGSVTYHFYTTIDCSGTPADQTVTLDSNGNAPNSATHGPLTAGSYSFKADYSGDSNFEASTSDCEPFRVNQAPSTIVTTMHNAVGGTVIPVGSTQPFGLSVYDTADVSGTVGSIAMTGTVTFNFFTNGGCSDTPAFTETVALGQQSTTQGPLNTDGYSFQATYNGDSNYASSTSSCEYFSVTTPPHVTDTQFCPITTPFRLVLIQDTGSTYTLTATNPGQFYSNLFLTQVTPGSISVTMNIPYPFVTQGANPIQVFYNQPIPGCGSTVPPSNVNNEFTISPSGSAAITLSSYGSSPTLGVTTVTVTFTSQGTVPAGLYWFAIHLNYGLKGLDFSKVSPSTTSSAGNACVGTAGPCAQGANAWDFVDDPQTYAFSDSVFGSTAIQSVNKFNKDPGFAGVVTDGFGTPIPNVPVTIFLSGKKLATVYTDANGVYLYQYKYTGSPTSYTVSATYGVTKSVSGTIKSNALIVINFQFP